MSQRRSTEKPAFGKRDGSDHQRQQPSRSGQQGQTRTHAQPTLKEITAPYNFVPLAEWVHDPRRGNIVSHDLPLRDGYSGILAMEIEAVTPLLVGTTSNGKEPKAVTMYRVPGARQEFAIPGSSLRGMFRNVIEIATFSKMTFADDNRYGIRDLTSKRTDRLYRNEVNAHPPSAGWLRFTGSGWELTPCEYASIFHNELDVAFGVTFFGGLHLRGNLNSPTVRLAFHKYDSLYGPNSKLPPVLNFDPQLDSKTSRRFASKLGTGSKLGTVVFTGQVNAMKKREFLFYDRRGTTLSIDENVVRDFLFIHAKSADWMRWNERIRTSPSTQVPVFYRSHSQEPGRVTSMGLAYMYKMAYKNTVRDLIGRASPGHNAAALADFADCLFGHLKEGAHGGLKSRISFSQAVLVSGVREEQAHTTILGAPKPSYFPNYIEQQASPDGKLIGDYCSYSDPNTRIRGWKRYPVRNANWPDAAPHADQSDSSITLRPLAAGAKFKSKVRFHNLHKSELGALVWAIEWGGKPELAHSLGMGKPFGLGQLKFRIVEHGSELIPNDPGEPRSSSVRAKLDDLQKKEFIDEMNGACRDQSIGPWIDSIQMQHLIAMANPANAEGRSLVHMKLETQGGNDFADAKGRTPKGEPERPALVLKPYIQLEQPHSVAGRAAAKGHVSKPPEPVPPAEVAKWIGDVEAEFCKPPYNIAKGDLLRNVRLVERLATISNSELKRAALGFVVAVWKHRGWWETKTGATAKAKVMLIELLGSS